MARRFQSGNKTHTERESGNERNQADVGGECIRTVNVVVMRLVGLWVCNKGIRFLYGTDNSCLETWYGYQDCENHMPIG